MPYMKTPFTESADRQLFHLIAFDQQQIGPRPGENLVHKIFIQSSPCSNNRKAESSADVRHAWPDTGSLRPGCKSGAAESYCIAAPLKRDPGFRLPYPA